MIMFSIIDKASLSVIDGRTSNDVFWMDNLKTKQYFTAFPLLFEWKQYNLIYPTEVPNLREN